MPLSGNIFICAPLLSQHTRGPVTYLGTLVTTPLCHHNKANGKELDIALPYFTTSMTEPCSMSSFGVDIEFDVV